MSCIHSLLNKNVINIRNGESIGCVCDILVDTDCGMVVKLVVPQNNSIFSLFSKEDNYHIKWCDVVKVGEDLILVDTHICRKE